MKTTMMYKRGGDGLHWVSHRLPRFNQKHATRGTDVVARLPMRARHWWPLVPVKISCLLSERLIPMLEKVLIITSQRLSWVTWVACRITRYQDQCLCVDFAFAHHVFKYTFRPGVRERFRKAFGTAGGPRVQFHTLDSCALQRPVRLPNASE